MAMAGAVEKGTNKARRLQSADQRPLFQHFPSLIRPSPQTPSPYSRNSRLQNADPLEARVRRGLNGASGFQLPQTIRYRLEMPGVVPRSSSRKRGIDPVDLGADEKTRHQHKGNKRRGANSSLIRTPPVWSGTIRDSVIAQLTLSGPVRSPRRRQLEPQTFHVIRLSAYA